MSEQEIEQEILAKGLKAARLTPADIDNAIAGSAFIRATEVLTICILTLRNGFTVTGESACASPENYDKELGQKIAFGNARDKIWVLEGYLLKQGIFNAQSSPDAPQAVKIAEVAHDINKAYCQALGDDSQPEWADAPEWQQESAVSGVLFHMANPTATPEDSHKSWLKEKAADGWRYGPVKDATAKTHPCIIDYEDLPVEQRAKDYLFRQTVHSIYRLNTA